MYKVRLSSRALKDLKKLEKETQSKVIESLEILKLNPFAEIIQYKKLKGRNQLYRIRIGSYRVIYEIQGEILVIIVIRIGHRKDVYRYLKEI